MDHGACNLNIPVLNSTALSKDNTEEIAHIPRSCWTTFASIPRVGHLKHPKFHQTDPNLVFKTKPHCRIKQKLLVVRCVWDEVNQNVLTIHTIVPWITSMHCTGLVRSFQSTAKGTQSLKRQKPPSCSLSHELNWPSGFAGFAIRVLPVVVHLKPYGCESLQQGHFSAMVFRLVKVVPCNEKLTSGSSST